MSGPTIVTGKPAGGAGGAHDLLSATHSDTTAAAVSRGSVVVGDSVPKWIELVIGAVGTILQRNASADVVWQTFLELAEIAAPGAAAANVLRHYLVENGVGAQLRTKDEYGLVDILSERDPFRSRKRFYWGQGHDSPAGATDVQTWGMQFAAAEGTVANVTGDADGQRKSFATVATIDTDAGLPGPFTQTRLDFNPDVTIKFKVTTTTNRRVWIGWMESDHMASDTSAAIHKFALRLSTTAANVNFCIVHSNGTTETITQIGTADALIHTIRLVADNANSRWGYSWDGGTVVWVTTNIPAATALVGMQDQIRTVTAAAIVTLEHWFGEGSMEK